MIVIRMNRMIVCLNFLSRVLSIVYGLIDFGHGSQVIITIVAEGLDF